MKPKTFLNAICALLYEKRLVSACDCFESPQFSSQHQCRFGPYFVEPIVAGLNEDGTTYIASADLIGCPMTTDDFVVGGTASDQLFGICEAFYRPNLVSHTTNLSICPFLTRCIGS